MPSMRGRRSHKSSPGNQRPDTPPKMASAKPNLPESDFAPWSSYSQPQSSRSSMAKVLSRNLQDYHSLHPVTTPTTGNTLTLGDPDFSFDDPHSPENWLVRSEDRKAFNHIEMLLRNQNLLAPNASASFMQVVDIYIAAKGFGYPKVASDSMAYIESLLLIGGASHYPSKNQVDYVWSRTLRGFDLRAKLGEGFLQEVVRPDSRLPWLNELLRSGWNEDFLSTVDWFYRKHRGLVKEECEYDEKNCVVHNKEDFEPFDEIQSEPVEMPKGYREKDEIWAAFKKRKESLLRAENW